MRERKCVRVCVCMCVYVYTSGSVSVAQLLSAFHSLACVCVCVWGQSGVVTCIPSLARMLELHC